MIIPTPWVNSTPVDPPEDLAVSHHFCYSPYPIVNYFLEGESIDEVRVLHSFDDGATIWNLFWMSHPALDNIPGSGMRWHKVYRPVPNLLANLAEDVGNDEALRRRLNLHPASFFDWFERQDHAEYRTFHSQGGRVWVDTVLSRAQLAIDRLLAESPVLQVVDNVVKIDFKRKVA